MPLLRGAGKRSLPGAWRPPSRKNFERSTGLLTRRRRWQHMSKKLRKNRKSEQKELIPAEAEVASTLAPDTVHQMQELWMVLAKQEWTSLAVLPAHRDGSTDELVRTLAEVGRHLCDQPISTATVATFGPGSTRALATLARQMEERQKRLWSGSDVIDVESDPPMKRDDDESFLPASGRLIIGVPSVVAMPVALAVAQAADTVILGVELGKTAMKDLRRSIELIGRERIVGSVLY